MPAGLFNISGESFSLIVGLYGAIVASGVALYKIARDRLGVKVILVPGIKLPDGDKKAFESWVLRINHRKRSFTIRGAGLYVDDGGLGKIKSFAGRHLERDGSVRVGPTFPVTLADGEDLEVWIERSEEDADRVKGAFANDG